MTTENRDWIATSDLHLVINELEKELTRMVLFADVINEHFHFATTARIQYTKARRE